MDVYELHFRSEQTSILRLQKGFRLSEIFSLGPFIQETMKCISWVSGCDRMWITENKETMPYEPKDGGCQKKVLAESDQG